MISVLVPWRPSPERQRVWDALRPRWEALGYEVIEGTCVGPWSKGTAVAEALARASHKVLVVADADVWCDGLEWATAEVYGGSPWAIPHYRVVRLGPDGNRAERPYPGVAGGGLVVLARETYEQCPIDPRFEGWGQEDEAWGHALRTLYGKPRRGLADLTHYWHPPQQRQNRAIGSPEGAALLRRYLAARTPQAIREILQEVA